MIDRAQDLIIGDDVPIAFVQPFDGQSVDRAELEGLAAARLDERRRQGPQA